jgi:hypothetical protein
LNIHELQGETPATVLTGSTADISHICEFGWYDYVWYLSAEGTSLECKYLGHYCGPSFDVGDALCARILTSKGKFVNYTSVFPLTDADHNNEVISQKKASMKKASRKPLKKSITH